VANLFEEDQMWTGLVLIIAMTLLVVSGIFFKFLKTFFETFLRLHWFLFLIVLVFCIIHGTILTFIVSIAFLGLDLILRLIFTVYYKNETKTVSLTKLKAVDIIKLSWKKKISNTNQVNMFSLLFQP